VGGAGWIFRRQLFHGLVSRAYHRGAARLDAATRATPTAIGVYMFVTQIVGALGAVVDRPDFGYLGFAGRFAGGYSCVMVFGGAADAGGDIFC